MLTALGMRRFFWDAKSSPYRVFPAHQALGPSGYAQGEAGGRNRARLPGSFIFFKCICYPVFQKLPFYPPDSDSVYIQKIFYLSILFPFIQLKKNVHTIILPQT